MEIGDRSSSNVPSAKPAAPVPNSPPKTISLTIPLTEQPGDRIGPYKLLQQIGEGGCGSVYMAEQEQPVRRRVALKVIKLGMDTRSVIARFEAERQALALMDHPNIARVLDAGATETGRPYFVMELVRGIKITDYCDQNKLSVADRLKLFIEVCHAIQHAHQKGVIHRDIKPSNILVTMHDGVPVPKVIDFGIAKATDQRLTDKTLFTQFEQFIGTPAYMSPEQAEMSGLDIDTRSDIYALGVLLYELLTGRTPFDAKELMKSGIDAMRRTIREQEPERPSTRLTGMTQADLASTAQQHRSDPPKLVSLVRGDLDWIVMKTLEKDRTRRYETANGLASDVQRYLNNEPIEARPPSTIYRLQKTVRRNKPAFIGAGAVALALLLGFVGCLFLYLKEKDLYRRAVAAEKEQSRLREKAEQTAMLEARLRRNAELGAQYSNAGLLMSRGDIEAAEKIVSELPPGITMMPFLNVFTIFHAARGEWAEALTNCSSMAQYCGTNSLLRDSAPGVYHYEMPLLVQTGDLKGYRERRAQILRDFGTNPDPVICERMAKDCMILPPEPGQLDTISKMADQALAAGPTHRSWAYFQFVKGLSEFRSGHLPEAAEWLQKTAQQTNDTKRTVQALSALAMTHLRLGRRDEAQKTLASATTLAEARLPAPSRKGGDEVWHDWIIARALLREATETISAAGKEH
jgi:serine/threonine protein kinase